MSEASRRHTCGFNTPQVTGLRSGAIQAYLDIKLTKLRKCHLKYKDVSFEDRALTVWGWERCSAEEETYTLQMIGTGEAEAFRQGLVDPVKNQQEDLIPSQLSSPDQRTNIWVFKKVVLQMGQMFA
ncbi:unnamed protein product [Allacma fusca]|uniref:Uncharacterized protein n=1 Tax=Allacma fusca TaxID=39272 RepID=A0A8J2LBL4_9HEXA|nr:unnamed protein product [Allacma fusca]